MDFIVLNNFITKYDETGRAVLFISFDDNFIFWDISLPEKYKDMYAKQFEDLEMTMLNIPFGNCQNKNSRIFSFTEHASQILDIVYLSIPDIKEARIPDCFLKSNGDIDLEFLRKLNMSMDFEPVKDVPYCIHACENFGFAYGLKVLILSQDKYLQDKKVAINQIDRDYFEAALSNFQLKNRWVDLRQQCVHFYAIYYNEKQILIAFDVQLEPQFFFRSDNLTN